ncbi:MAG TPA: hypothetical protein ENN44_02965 [Methanoculleus sp.]|nr:hypothetical protein [Methanoculleus sp.]
MNVIATTITQISGGNLSITALFIIGAIFGVFWISMHDKQLALLTVFMMTLPFIIGLFLSGRMPMSPRYMIFLMPLYFIAIAAALEFVPMGISPIKIVAVVLAIIFILNLPALIPYYSGYSKNDWRGFSADFSGMTGKGDIVVVMPGYMTLPFNYYYNNSTDGTLEYEASRANVLVSIDKEHAGTPTYYVLTGDINAANPDGDSLQWLEQNATFLGNRGGIYLFGRNVQSA